MKLLAWFFSFAVVAMLLSPVVQPAAAATPTSNFQITVEKQRGRVLKGSMSELELYCHNGRPSKRGMLDDEAMQNMFMDDYQTTDQEMRGGKTPPYTLDVDIKLWMNFDSRGQATSFCHKEQKRGLTKRVFPKMTFYAMSYSPFFSFQPFDDALSNAGLACYVDKNAESHIITTASKKYGVYKAASQAHAQACLKYGSRPRG